MISIEPAQPSDLPQLVDLLQSLFAQEQEFTPAPAKQEAGLRLILTSPEIGILFVARIGEEVAGMVSLLFTVSTAEGCRVCWLEDMVVRPDRRGAGVGTALLRHAIDWARRHGFGRITLLTDTTNNDAIRFYARAGFAESPMTAMRLRPMAHD